ncbi:hypothetical protein EMPS_03178 [Entomortierella parvispora]|uniref:Uncharacterized protein n=1 Tax=Entomortierella parvispora TaxID=205924 RepID=A0A9P3H6S1_9FUNG|nr:hypothetical protein EMPS_03178 [Entomortierella parvispora]
MDGLILFLHSIHFPSLLLNEAESGASRPSSPDTVAGASPEELFESKHQPMSSLPVLPFVVLRAHKPGTAEDILAQQGPLQSESMETPTFAITPSSASTTAKGSLRKSPTSLSTGEASGGSTKDTSTGKASTPTIFQTRTLHPQVHYLFENDPLEAEILDSIPKSRCITLDLDPRSGMISHVESYLAELQVMDVRWESLSLAQQLSPSPSLSSSSPHTEAVSTLADSTSSPSSVRTVSSVVMNSTSLSRRPSDRSLKAPLSSLFSESSGTSANTGGGSSSQDGKPTASPSRSPSGATLSPGTEEASGGVNHKDLSLVIYAVEMDPLDQQHSDSELLETSMISSLDTESIPEDYLSHCDALLKSFSSRNALVKKVIDFTATHSSLSTAQSLS